MKPIRVLVYIAGSISSRKRLREVRDKLAEVNVGVTARWLEHPDNYVYETNALEAVVDYTDIDSSNFLILDTLGEMTRGGREWEAGYATGKGKQVLRVGPAITPFHASLSKSFEDWDACIAFIATAMEHADARDN